MTYTETTRTSWFTKLKNGVIGTLVGIVLVLVAVYFLFWNEGRAIQTYRALVEGAGLVVSVDSSKVDAANDGKLVHISGAVKPIDEAVASGTCIRPATNSRVELIISAERPNCRRG